MSKRKRKHVDYTELDGPEAKELLERFGLTQELDKIQMHMEIARPEQVKSAEELVFNTVCSDGRDLWLVAMRKFSHGKYEDKVYQVHRPKRIGTEEMQQAVDAVADHLVGVVEIREGGDLVDFGGDS